MSVSGGIALECTRDGRVQGVLRAALETRPPITPGSRLVDAVADASHAEQREFVTTIHETSDYMRRLVDDLLEVSRIEAGKLVLELAPCDLSALVRRHVALQQILAHRKRIHIEFGHEEPIAVLADAVKIGQVLHNLIGNAITYCRPIPS